MKFSKLYSCAVVACGGFLLGGGFLCVGGNKNAAHVPSLAGNVTLDSVPALKMRADTVVVNYDTKLDAAGAFVTTTNELIVKHFVPGPMARGDVVNYCEKLQGAERVVRRHEFEHAKKARIVRTRRGLNAYQAAQLVIMNESMAPAGEIIEAMTYRFETGRCYPVNRSFLFRTDSLIMAEHAKHHLMTSMVDFENPVIADIVLESAVDKFILDYNRGVYHFAVRRALAGMNFPEYTAHDHCDEPNWKNYCPDKNQWGALWTFDVAPFVNCTDVYNNARHVPCTTASNYNRVDIWNSATPATRKRVLNKIHDCIMQEMTPGQMLLTKTFKKIR